jgi:short-subunit dehydrogenase
MLVEETSIEAAMDVFATNFWGVVRVTNAFLPTMRRQRSGLIINVSSLAGLVGVPGQAFYAASKHALEGYTVGSKDEHSCRSASQKKDLCRSGVWSHTGAALRMARGAGRCPEPT